MLEALKDYVRELWEETRNIPKAGSKRGTLDQPWILDLGRRQSIALKTTSFHVSLKLVVLGQIFGKNPQHSYLLAFCATKFPKSYKPSECL